MPGAGNLAEDEATEGEIRSHEPLAWEYFFALASLPLTVPGNAALSAS